MLQGFNYSWQRVCFVHWLPVLVAKKLYEPYSDIFIEYYKDWQTILKSDIDYFPFVSGIDYL